MPKTSSHSMHRDNILLIARAVTTKQRNAEYGDPKDNLQHTAELINAYLFGKYGITETLTAEDVAWIMVMVKCARTYRPKKKQDNYVDAAAYTAIAGEVSNDGS